MLELEFNNLTVQQLQAGLALFNAARFFEAHELLEDAWREAPPHSARRRHLQGLVQVAVALHHHSTGNLVGARSVLRRAVRNLEGAELTMPDLDLGTLRASLAAWQEYLDEINSADRKGTAPSRNPSAKTSKSPALPVIIVKKPT